MGRVRGDRIECGYHGLQFDGGGTCVAVSGQTRVPPGARAARYPLVERDRFVWISMGDTDRMDSADIPDFHWLDHPDWRAEPSYLHIRCNHRLLIDNLLDLSHLPFVHPTTLGEMGVAETPATTEGDRSRGMSNCNLNAITPETETSLHQFWAQAHGARITMPGITEGMHDQVRTAFLEDIAFLEAQQKRNEAWPHAARIDINADAAHLEAGRLMDRLRAEEAAGAAAAE